MKTPLTPSSSTTGRRSANTPSAVADASHYISVTQTQAFIAGSLAARMARMKADDMLNADMAADRMGTNRATINTWIADGRCIGLAQTARDFKLPSWQFEPEMADAVHRLSKALDTREGWALLTFLETPLGALGGRIPRQAIEQGHLARVVELAAVHAASI